MHYWLKILFELNFTLVVFKTHQADYINLLMIKISVQVLFYSNWKPTSEVDFKNANFFLISLSLIFLFGIFTCLTKRQLTNLNNWFVSTKITMTRNLPSTQVLLPFLSDDPPLKTPSPSVLQYKRNGDCHHKSWLILNGTY